MMNNRKVTQQRIFLVSFTILFFELLCIRWVPSYVRYLSYFSNFILLGAFLGVGVGVLSESRKVSLLRFFPASLAAFVFIIIFTKFNLVVTSPDALYFQSNAGGARLESYWLLPFVFGAVALLFIPLGQELGRHLKGLEPLQAYKINIWGSLLGIAVFSALALFSAPPVIWFAIALTAVLLLLPRKELAIHFIFVIAILGSTLYLAKGDYWSAYYRISVTPLRNIPHGYFISVNGISCQFVATREYKEAKEPFYVVPYKAFSKHPFKRALIIGSGTGTDTAFALANQVQHVDAVEIDPTILRLGELLNPDKPYSDPRVSAYVDDARAFLKKNTTKYDLIVFALPDSLTLTSSFANLRLESFLFTKEAFQSAREHLEKNGVLVLYNYYRQDWLIQKIGTMLYQCFGQWPHVVTFGGWGRAAVFMIGPRLQEIEPFTGPFTKLDFSHAGFFEGPPATDDWPFLYLKARRLSSLYLKSLGLVMLFAIVLVWSVCPRGSWSGINPHFFFLGAAFMLLEVKNIVEFSLLFGSTWVVNSLVFFAILTMVLLAIYVNRKIHLEKIWIFYLLLFGLLFLAYLIPFNALLNQKAFIRYVLASFFGFSPIFIANIVFAHSFRNTRKTEFAFGSNLLGALFGGVLEYLSLVIGYHQLGLFVILLYALAFLARKKAALPAV